MISSTHYQTLQKTTVISGTNEPSGATASEEVKFGDTFRRVYRVFNENTLKEANIAIDKDSGYFIADSEVSSLLSELCSSDVDLRRGRIYYLGLISETFSWETNKTKVTVKFDRNCQIINSRKLIKHLNTSNDALIKLTKNGLEVLARQFSLNGRSVKVDHVYIVREFIPCGGSSVDKTWGKNTGQYTLRVQMNDDSVRKEHSSYYTGGGFEIAEYEKAAPFKGKLPNKKTIEFYGPVPNGGIVYSNVGELIHKDQSADHVSKNDGMPLERRLFIATITVVDQVSKRSQGAGKFALYAQKVWVKLKNYSASALTCVAC